MTAGIKFCCVLIICSFRLVKLENSWCIFRNSWCNSQNSWQVSEKSAKIPCIFKNGLKTREECGKLYLTVLLTMRLVCMVAALSCSSRVGRFVLFRELRKPDDLAVALHTVLGGQGYVIIIRIDGNQFVVT